MTTRNVFSFDAETDGLWGKAFALAAIVYDKFGNEVARFMARLDDSVVTNDWVRENVLPKLAGVPVTHVSYEEMLRDFSKFYLEHKSDADVIAHMGFIVEAKLLRDMVELGFIGEWDGPYPLFDVSGNLQAAGEDPTSVDAYAKKNGLQIPEFNGGTHNPLYDSAVTAVVYRHLRQRELAPKYIVVRYIRNGDDVVEVIQGEEAVMSYLNDVGFDFETWEEVVNHSGGDEFRIQEI